MNKQPARSCGFLRSWLIGVLLTGAAAAVLGEQPAVRFRHITDENGLSQCTVYSIIQDSRGFMWFGTQEGLNRYDGYQTVVYNPEPFTPTSLSSGEVLTVAEDRQGMIWVGTRGGGLNRFDRRSERFSRYLNRPDESNSLSNDDVTVLLEDRRGSLWIGTNGGGLNRYRPDSDDFERFEHDPDDDTTLSDNRVLCLHEDRQGVLWIGTNGGGLDRLQESAGRHLTHLRHRPGDEESLCDDRVHAILEDRRGELWIGTAGGLCRFDRATGRFIRFTSSVDDPQSLSDNRVTAIFEDSHDQLWIGTMGGLNRFHRPGGRFTRCLHDITDPESLSHNLVTAITEDRSGLLWVATWQNINLLDRTATRFNRYQHHPGDRHSLSHNRVFALCEDHAGVLWIATEGGGLNRMERQDRQHRRQEGRFSHFRHDPRAPNSLPSDDLFAVCEDHRHQLWIGSNGGGLSRLDASRRYFTHYRHDSNDPASLSDDDILCLLVDRSGELWIGTKDGGLNRLDRDNGRFKHYRHDPRDPSTLSHDSVLSLSQDRSGRLWIGTWGGGLNRHDADHDRFIRYQHDPDDPDSLSDRIVTVIHEDRSGRIWIGTSNGLDHYLPETEGFSHITEDDGLASDSIIGMLEDDTGSLWISTVKGICRFDPEAMTFRNYDRSDGLLSNDFSSWSYCRCRDGEMFFGSVEGLNSFFPADIADNPHAPQVVITDFKLFNRPVPIGADAQGRVILPQAISETDRLSLSYQDSVISFEYAALHYVAPDKIEYAYRLQGFEEDWNRVGNRRFVTYTNLPAGEYLLRVIAANNDGIWNREGATLAISVEPPPWQKLWFRVAGIALVVLLVVSLYGYRVHRIKARNRQLEAAVAERTAKLQQEISERVAVEHEREQLISELTQALAEVKTLSGMLPICSSCKRIRDDEGYWQQVEVYLKKHSEAAFSHGICPDCTREIYPEIYSDVFPETE